MSATKEQPKEVPNFTNAMIHIAHAKHAMVVADHVYYALKDVQNRDTLGSVQPQYSPQSIMELLGTAADRIAILESKSPPLADDVLPEEIKLPGILAVAFASDRPELLTMYTGAMDVETTGSVVHALGVVMKKNRQLRLKLSAVRSFLADAIPTVRNNLDAMLKKVKGLDKEITEVLDV